MKSPLLFIALIVFGSLSQTLAQNCQAGFTFGETGLTIAFADASTVPADDPIASWFWDFDDGTNSTLANPTHTFPEVDKFDVCLTITTESGCTSQSCIRIEICQLSLTVELGDCNGNNNIPLTISVTDLYNSADKVNLYVDGQLLVGSPYDIQAGAPLVILDSVPGDGLLHMVSVQSEKIGTCGENLSFYVPDCTSDCFLSAFGIGLSGGGLHTVEIRDNFFSPQTVTIEVGDTVRFVWLGNNQHSSTSDATSGPDSWNSGEIGFGSSFDVLISQPGLHPFYCIPHGGPGGVGMSGVIVANCPASGQFMLNLSFNTSLADSLGYQVLLDSVPIPGGPFFYSGLGAQSNVLPLAGDGLLHSIVIQDVADPNCALSRTYTAPDCGAAPPCSLSLSTIQAGPCNAASQALFDITVNAINPGADGFLLFLDGNQLPGGPFSYSPNGPTTITVELPGDGQLHVLEAGDVADPSCMAAISFTSPDCTIPCVFSNLTANLGTSTVHSVLVEDFAFNPQHISITAGDLVEWQWVGVVHHTSTSDASSGPDSWNSGLLMQGASFTSPALSAGVHPYYCIPHGAPGGIGMSGTITVLPDCSNGLVSVGVEFTTTGAGFNGFEVLVDGVPAGSFPYGQGSIQSASVQAPGDGQSHTITVRDQDNPGCEASTSIVTPDCNAGPCQLSLSAQLAGDCNPDLEVPYELSVNISNGGNNGFMLLLDGNLYPGSPFPYQPAPLGIWLPGDGLSHTLLVVDVDSLSCSQELQLATPLCSNECSLSLAALQSGGCNASGQLPFSVSVAVENPAGSAFNLFIDGLPYLGNPVAYGSGGQTSLSVLLEGDGGVHQLLATDLANSDCQAGLEITTQDCSAACQLRLESVVIGVPRVQVVEVLDFEFSPKVISVEAGDTVRFVWLGAIPHTTTSDTPSGEDSWNSGLLGQGGSYDVVLQNPGTHPYYCIPHGSPGGIGMSGVIQVIEPCADDSLQVAFLFSEQNAGFTGYRALIDGALLPGSPFAYHPDGVNTVLANIPADGLPHQFRIEDTESPSCLLDTLFQMPDCGDPCFGFAAAFGFTTDPQNLDVQFTDASTGGPENWSWQFGDGGVSIEQNPIYTYSSEGAYNACLVAQNNTLGCADTTCQVVDVGAFVCQAAFTYEIDGLSVSFSDASLSNSPISNYTWSLGNGLQIVGQSDPSFTYEALGVYTVCLTIQGGACVADTCLILDLSDPCLAFQPEYNYSVDPDNGLRLSFIDLTTGSPSRWLWGFGDGQTSSQQYSTHTYTQSGEYTVCLLVQDTINGCNEALCRVIPVLLTHSRQEPRPSSLNIFPNPGNRQTQAWWVEGLPEEDWGQNLVLRVFNLQGTQVMQGGIAGAERLKFRLPSSFSSGIYLLELRSEAHIYKARLVVQ